MEKGPYESIYYLPPQRKRVKKKKKKFWKFYKQLLENVKG
jgi:hypothetical protein